MAQGTTDRYIPVDIRGSFIDPELSAELRAKLRDIKVESIQQHLHRYNQARFPPVKSRFSRVEMVGIMMQAHYLPPLRRMLNGPSILWRLLENR